MGLGFGPLRVELLSPWPEAKNKPNSKERKRLKRKAEAGQATLLIQNSDLLCWFSLMEAFKKVAGNTQAQAKEVLSEGANRQASHLGLQRELVKDIKDSGF